MRKGSVLVPAVVLACGIASARGPETSEKAWSFSVPLAGKTSLRVENLLGSVRVRGTSGTGAATVNVRVVSEASTSADATNLAGGV